MKTQAVNIVFDGAPELHPRFVTVELDDDSPVNAGIWIQRPDGLWSYRIIELPEVTL